MLKNSLNFFTFLLLLFLLALLPSHIFQTAYSQSEKASISGFAITPSKVEAYVPQGYAAKTTIKVIGIKPANAYIKWLGGSREGVNITITKIQQVGGATLITVTIFAYRPGFYKYGLYIELPTSISAGGGVRAIPVVIVPIYVIVPGVRVSLINLNVDMATRTVTLCVGLVPYFAGGKTGPGGYNTKIVAMLDNRIIAHESIFIEKGMRKCFHLGPFKPHTLHTFMITAEADNVSRDGMRVQFTVGKIVVKLSLAVVIHNPYIVFFGGVVKALYTLHLDTNSSKCLVDLKARMGSLTKRISYNVQGKMGVMHHYRFNGVISGYVPPQILIPTSTVPLNLQATARCIGLQHPATTGTHAVLLVIDLTPLLVYAAMAAAVYTMLRIRRRRRKREDTERSVGGDEYSITA